MIVARSIEELKREKNSVVTVGTFDGVHLAHQQIVREVVYRARMKEGRSVVVTFDPHPKEIVGDKSRPIALLTTIDERIELLRQMSVDLL
ncbi:MAG: adenylyltransferase/cytidyltransferase family protein, partial [bacterium]